jgi:hypothetical protein
VVVLAKAKRVTQKASLGLSSFERLAQAAVNVLIAKGLVDAGDLRVRMARLAVGVAGVVRVAR